MAYGLRWCMALFVGLMAGRALAAPSEAELQLAVKQYFADLFGRLERVAAQAPTESTFRNLMWEELKGVDGVYGGSLIDAQWTIRQVLHRRDVLAVGYSLAKVAQLDVFRAEMAEHPGPQLSEPARGRLWQPRLISLRYPILREGKMVHMASLLIRTDAFLTATGLDNCKAFTITCRGQEAECKGKLTPTKRAVTVMLPSTEWMIHYE